MFTRLVAPLLAPLRASLQPVADRYKQRLIPYLAEALPATGTVLDVGCDDGQVAEQIESLRPELAFQGVDIQSLRACAIPRQLYNGRDLPLADNAVDAVLAVDMLHHTRCIPHLLGEMARVTRRWIIIKDHQVTGWRERIEVGLGDWFLNAPWGIPCTFNYPTREQWLALFHEHGLRVARHVENLSLGPRVKPWNNPLFVLEKSAVSATTPPPSGAAQAAN